MADGDSVQGAGAGELTEAAAPEWLGGLPDDLKGDATLGKYADVESLARGHLETKRLASSKLNVPGADATPEDWTRVYEALGRPKDAKDYDLGLEPLPALADGASEEEKGAHAALTAQREAMEAAYKEAGFEAGLRPDQLKALVKRDMARIQEASDAYYAKGQEEIGALKTELGADYESKKEAAKAAFKAIFGDDAESVALADELDQKVGSGRLMRAMMKLAEKTGEHNRVDGKGGELGDVKDAGAQLDAKFADKDWRKRYLDGDQATVQEHDRLMDAARKAAAAPSAR